MFQHFMTMFNSSDAPNPHDVAEAISELIEAPKGTRPARTVVGMSFGADTLNDATEPVQAGAVKGLGLDQLATVTGSLFNTLGRRWQRHGWSKPAHSQHRCQAELTTPLSITISEFKFKHDSVIHHARERN
jgi:hypothetical protein